VLKYISAQDSVFVCLDASVQVVLPVWTVCQATQQI